MKTQILQNSIKPNHILNTLNLILGRPQKFLTSLKVAQIFIRTRTAKEIAYSKG